MGTELIQSAVPDAFITITKIKEIRGAGLRWKDIRKQRKEVYEGMQIWRKLPL